MENQKIRTVNLTAGFYDHLAEQGIKLARALGRVPIHEDTEFEAPCINQGHFRSGIPFRMGAFSGIIGGTVHGSIGRYCSIAAGSMIGPGDHPTDRLTSSWVGYVHEFNGWRKLVHGADAPPPVVPLPFVSQQAVIIGNDVWIGANVFIKGGIQIGDGAIVAAGSVVVKNVPAYAIVGGNPAKVIKFRFDEALIERLVNLKWWQYSYFEIQQYQRRDLAEMLTLTEEAIGLKKILPWEGKRIKLLAAAEKMNRDAATS